MKAANLEIQTNCENPSIEALHIVDFKGTSLLPPARQPLTSAQRRRLRRRGRSSGGQVTGGTGVISAIQSVSW